MTPRRGPSKKLAPTIGVDSGCPHEYTEDEALQLEIDCSHCNGAHDLGNKKCFSAVLNILAGGAQPEAIILKRFIHKRYRGDTVELASLAAAALASLNRAIASTVRPSDRKCRTCPASRDQLLTTIKHLMMDDPAKFVLDRSSWVGELKGYTLSLSCAGSMSCLDAALQIADARAGAKA